MRGYEQYCAADPRASKEFRIPMRGYELDDRQLRATLARVPNPHEGL